MLYSYFGRLKSELVILTWFKLN